MKETAAMKRKTARFISHFPLRVQILKRISPTKNIALKLKNINN